MSSSTSALKASKSIVDSYVSSSERSNLTTTFTLTSKESQKKLKALLSVLMFTKK